MKKRLFRNFLILCLLLITLTAAVSAATFNGLFYKESATSSNIDWDKAPVKQIDMEATFYCNKCKSNTTVIDPTSPQITLTGIQFPVDGDYHRMTLTVEISEFTCNGCGSKIGPIQNLNVTFTTTQNDYFCHSGARYDTLKASGSQTIDSGRIEFAIGTTPNYTLTQCSERPATCAQVGIKEGVNCKHCDGCGKYFDLQDTKTEIPANQVEIPKKPHDYNSETGKCTGCGAQAPARLDNTIYTTFEAALTAYNSGNGGTLTVFSMPADTSINLERSGALVISDGVTASKITVNDGLTVTIENSGTIDSIEMNNPGTLTIDNSGTIASINTPVKITGDGTRTINVTNTGTITRLEAPNTKLTVQNDGEIGELIGYFYPDDNDTSRVNMVTLKRGAGIYNKIRSVKQWNAEYTTATADFSKLLSDDDYFYFITPEKDKYWYRDGFRLTYFATNLTDVYFTCYPFSSVEVTGKADGSQVGLTRDGNSFTMTVDAGQDVTLTGDVLLPAQGLKSDKERLVYSWSGNAPGGSGSGNIFTFEDILYGEYDLTLTVTDNQYHHSKKVNIHIKAEKPADEKIELFFRIPSSGTVFTKIYDGTTAKPKPPHQVEIEFYVKNSSDAERTIPVSEDCYNATIAYKDKNCSDDNPITVTVELTEEGKKNYELGEKGTAALTVPGKITQADPYYDIRSAAEIHVGDSVFQRLTFAGFWYGRDTERQSLFTPVAPGTPIMVEGEPLSVTFYRLHPGNITSRGSSSSYISPGDFIHDPSMNEELTTDSTFTAAGEYYVYAVVQPTRNFEGVEKTGCLVIKVQNTEASSDHHTNYTAWDGTFTASVPVAANETKSVYLSSALPTIYTELLLGQGKKLTLCLNGKTLSATNSITSYNHIRVTDGAALTIDDCVGTGTVKGTAANGGQGGIAYVKNGTITIQNGKFTGGTASTGGAIVVDDKGVLNIQGGEISGNHVTSGSGGAIYIKSGGTVNLYGGTIRDNHVYSGNGGAIYVEAGGTLNLYGGTITGNTASTHGGGIYVEAGGTLNIHGAPVVTDNTAGGKASNIYLAGGQVLRIDGEMESGAKLGIGVEAVSYPALFASSAKNLSAYFTSDDPGAVVLYLNEKLTLCTRPTAELTGSTLTVTTGSDLSEDVKLLVAEYDANGKMLAAQVQDLQPERPSYTLTVKNPKAVIRCLLLRSDDTALLAAFGPLA